MAQCAAEAAFAERNQQIHGGSGSAIAVAGVSEGL
jgi:hypothetical protein